MPKTLFEKVWDAHAVRRLADGQTQLLVGTHLIHEVTSPQAFGMMRDLGLGVAMPHRTFATVDHIVPTDQASEPPCPKPFLRKSGTPTPCGGSPTARRSSLWERTSSTRSCVW